MSCAPPRSSMLDSTAFCHKFGTARTIGAAWQPCSSARSHHPATSICLNAHKPGGHRIRLCSCCGRPSLSHSCSLTVGTRSAARGVGLRRRRDGSSLRCCAVSVVPEDVPIPQTTVPPHPHSTTLLAGGLIEFWHKGEVCVGELVSSVAGKQSLKVKPLIPGISDGETFNIDVGQITDVWHQPKPEGGADWQRVQREARELLVRLPGHFLDLDSLRKAARTRGKKFLVRPEHVAEYLFTPWRINQSRKGKAFVIGAAGEQWRPSDAERLAAAQVLSRDTGHFKRVVSSRLDGQHGADAGVAIALGGFKPRDESVVASMEVLSFVELVQAARRRAAQQQGPGGRGPGMLDPSHLATVHQLEMLASGEPPQQISPEALRVLQTLGLGGDSGGAGAVLRDLGLWTEGGAQRENARPDDAANVGLQPWPEEALQAAKGLASARAKKERRYAEWPPKELGAPAPFGRRDFRGAEFGVYCIDDTATGFPDDAVSINPATREVLVHVVDLQAQLEEDSPLDQIARLRGQTVYRPEGPLFMLPPAVHKAVGFSTAGPNEAVTVGLTVDAATGAVTQARIMLTALGPVRKLSYAEADRLLAAGPESGDRASLELRALQLLASRSREAQQRGPARELGNRLVRTREGGVRDATSTQGESSRAMVDELLTLYTLEAQKACRRAGVALPTLTGLDKYVDSGKARFGTAPMRRYIDLLAQRQIAAVVRGKGFVTKKKLAEAVRWLTVRRNSLLKTGQQEQGRLLYEALSAKCARQMQATGQPFATLQGVATGEGRQVALGDPEMHLHVKKSSQQSKSSGAFETGQTVHVRVIKVDMQLQQVVAEEDQGI